MGEGYSELPEEPDTSTDDGDEPDGLEIPKGNDEVPDDPEITIEEDGVPYGGLIPKTGQLASIFIYGAGASLIMLGIYRKNR